MIIKVFIVRAQTAQPDGAYGPVRTLGDPFIHRAMAERRKTHWLDVNPEYGHAFIETHWIEVGKS